MKRATGDAESKTINATADAQVTKVTGEAEAGKIQAVGDAEASVLEKKGKAIDPRNYAAIEIARSLSTSGQKLVPDIMVGDGGSEGGSPASILMAMMVRQQLKESNGHAPATAGAEK